MQMAFKHSSDVTKSVDDLIKTANVVVPQTQSQGGTENGNIIVLEVLLTGLAPSARGLSKRALAVLAWVISSNYRQN